MATEKQLEANRRNALRSTGPKSEAGKAASRINALKHGMTAETLVILVDENPAELDARFEGFSLSIDPIDEVELCRTRHAAMLSWKLDRIDRHDVAVVNRIVRERAEAELARHRRKVREMMGRLLPTIEQFDREGFDTMPAADIVESIESTAEGCRMLLDCWDRQRRAIVGIIPWTTVNEMEILRLSGDSHRAIRNPAALDLLVAGRVQDGQSARLDPDQWEPGVFPMSFSREPLTRAIARRPETRQDAREFLFEAIEKITLRLEAMLELREREGDDWGAEESARSAMFDAGKEGERLRRYQTATYREFDRTLLSISKSRLQATKLEKDVILLEILRNEANLPTYKEEYVEEYEDCDDREAEQEAPSGDPERQILRNEPNSEAREPVPPPPMTPPKPAAPRNSTKFDLDELDRVEWIDVPNLL